MLRRAFRPPPQWNAQLPGHSITLTSPNLGGFAPLNQGMRSFGTEKKGNFNLPRWGQPENLQEVKVFRQDEDFDPKNILKRFEHPERAAVRTRVFGKSTSSLKTMTGEDAWREFGLSASELLKLPSMKRLGVVHDSSSVTRLFNKFEVQDAAIAKFGGSSVGQDKVDSAAATGGGGGSGYGRWYVKGGSGGEWLCADSADGVDARFELGLRSFKRRRKERGQRRRNRIHARSSQGLASVVQALALRRGAGHSSPSASKSSSAKKGTASSGARAGGGSGGKEEVRVAGRKGHVVGANAVTAAIAGNSAILVAKLLAYGYTGSGAMLSEAMHSGADLMNQSLLFYGLRRSSLKSDEDHPYGYGFETYVWSMISAVGSFFLGAGASIYHGAHALWHALKVDLMPTTTTSSSTSHPDLSLEAAAASDAAADAAAAALAEHAELMIGAAPVALTVLGFAGLLESYTALIAWRELSREAKKAKMRTKDYITDGPDPVNVAVFLEDAIAVAGIGVAAAGIGLTALTGHVAFDAMGSIGVGCLMGGVSVFVIAKNRRLLGQAVPESKASVVELLLKDEAVMTCLDVKAVTIRPGVCRFKAEIQFNPTTLADKYLDQHPDNLPGIMASLARALDATNALKQQKNQQQQQQQFQQQEFQKQHQNQHQPSAYLSADAATLRAQNNLAAASTAPDVVDALTAAAVDVGVGTFNQPSSYLSSGAAALRAQNNLRLGDTRLAGAGGVGAGNGSALGLSGSSDFSDMGTVVGFPSETAAAVTADEKELVRRAMAEALAEAKTAEALRQQLHRYSRMLLLTLALEVDRLEQLIREHHPEYHYIDLEVL